MTVPLFQALMRPLLAAYSDGLNHPITEAQSQVATELSLRDEDLAEMLPSGRQPTYYNRLRWAATYLKNAGALERVERGVYRITERGRLLLASNQESIDIKALEQFEEFRKFQSPSSTPKGERPAFDQDETPEERMEGAAKELRQALVLDLRERIAAMPPAAFEWLVLEVLGKIGYGGGRESSLIHLGRPGDQGLDGAIEQDRLGLDVLYVQAKRWKGDVGRREIQAFIGALRGAHASKGIVFTAGGFSPSATEHAKTVGDHVALVDGERLAEMMVDHDVGVARKASYVVKRVDPVRFGEEE